MSFIAICVSVLFFWRKPDEDSEDEDKAWNEKKGESHLEVSAYGFKTIYYVVSKIYKLQGIYCGCRLYNE